MPHVIRLRVPWRRQQDDAGRTISLRRFHAPTGLADATRVKLRLTLPPDAVALSLDGQIMWKAKGQQASETIAVEISQRLHGTHEISVTCQESVIDNAELEIEKADDPQP